MENFEILTEEGNKDSNTKKIRQDIVTDIIKKIRIMMILKSCKEDNIPSEVIPGLFLGSIGAALNKSFLQETGITHILSVADNIEPSYPSEFIYKVIKILDSPEVSLAPYLQECYEFICYGLASGKILVHCFAGKSRSVSVVIAFLMRVNHWSFEEAFSHTKEKRKVAEPNAGFVVQLKNLSN